jgi:hypothetical protein
VGDEVSAKSFGSLAKVFAPDKQSVLANKEKLR